MPHRTKKACSRPGCPELVPVGTMFCKAHTKQLHKDIDARRGTAHSRGYTGAWQKASKGYLRKHPLCVLCEREGKVNAATLVDHIIPHKGDKELFWDRNNWQGLCEYHHNRKTAEEDGAFNRRY